MSTSIHLSISLLLSFSQDYLFRPWLLFVFPSPVHICKQAWSMITYMTRILLSLCVNGLIVSPPTVQMTNNHPSLPAWGGGSHEQGTKTSNCLKAAAPAVSEWGLLYSIQIVAQWFWNHSLQSLIEPLMREV